MKHTADPTTTLLLAAHGSSRSGAQNPVQKLAENLNSLGLYADVCCGFLKEPPLLTQTLKEIETPNLVVVPMLSAHGYISDELIPKAMQALSDKTTVRLCKPLGTFESVPRIMADRARSVVEENKLESAKISILIAAHGNRKNPENAKQASAIARQIEELTQGIPTSAAYIEEPPLISDWHKSIESDFLIVLPFLIGGGLHGVEDIPAMLGLDTDDPIFEQLEDTPFIGPFERYGRSIWFCRALGHEPALVDVILDPSERE